MPGVGTTATGKRRETWLGLGLGLGFGLAAPEEPVGGEGEELRRARRAARRLPGPHGLHDEG